jgi:hypothetical protein
MRNGTGNATTMRMLPGLAEPDSTLMRSPAAAQNIPIGRGKRLAGEPVRADHSGYARTSTMDRQSHQVIALAAAGQIRLAIITTHLPRG